jgi:hypothetical protein
MLSGAFGDGHNPRRRSDRRRGPRRVTAARHRGLQPRGEGLIAMTRERHNQHWPPDSRTQPFAESNGGRMGGFRGSHMPGLRADTAPARASSEVGQPHIC